MKLCWGTLQCLYTKRVVLAHQAGSFIYIADGVVMRAAAFMVLTACGGLKRAASPGEAIVGILIDAAASRALSTRVITITSGRWFYWRRGRWPWVRGIRAIFDGVRCFHCDPTLASYSIGQATLHSDVTLLSPAFAPRVLYDPVIHTFFCAISYGSHSVVQCSTTSSTENTLQKLQLRKSVADASGTKLLSSILSLLRDACYN